MRRTVAAISILLALFFVGACVAATSVEGQVLAKVTYSGCRYFSCKACVVYFSSSSEAKAAGYTACKHCGG